MSKTQSVLLAAAILIVGALPLVNKWYQHKDDLYYFDYKYSMTTSSVEDLILTEPCQNVRTTLQITKESVTLTVNGDKLSGHVIAITPENILYVQFQDASILGFVVLKANETHDEDFLLVLGNERQTILSNIEDCEEITRFLESL